MIRGKEMPSHYYRGQISPSTPTDEEASRVDNNNTPDSASRVLRGLFRSREGQGNNILENRMSDSLSSIQQEHRQRTTPLMADTLMSGSTLLCRDDFVNRRSAWNPNSLFEHLGQQRIERTVNPNSSLFSSLDTNSFLTNNISNNGSMTGDKELDQTIRSFSSAFMSRRKILNNAGNNAGWISKRPRHFAARYRLVSQAVGQRGAQRVAALVKDIRHLRLECRKLSSEQEGQESAVRNIQSSLIVDAWENTPLDDLKNMNWEELLREGQEHVDAFRLWQQSTI